MRVEILADIAGVSGALLTAYGIGLYSYPAGIIFLGLVLIAAAVSITLGRKNK